MKEKVNDIILDLVLYRISNSPKSVLKNVFCAWPNLTALSVETYSEAWDIIVSKLPNENNCVCDSLSTPKYREMEEPDILYSSEVNRTYIEYLYMCVNNTNKSADRWKRLIKCLRAYDSQIQTDVLERLIGEVLAEFYCNGVYNKKVMELLLQMDRERRQIYEFIKFFICKGDVSLSDILEQVKSKNVDENLILNLIFLQNIEDSNTAIIAHESDERKKHSGAGLLEE